MTRDTHDTRTVVLRTVVDERERVFRPGVAQGPLARGCRRSRRERDDESRSVEDYDINIVDSTMSEQVIWNFLLRWLFLCRLVDDRAEVQTWPYRPPGYYEHPYHHPSPQQHKQIEHHQSPHGSDHGTAPPEVMDTATYRESVIRSLTSYPPGSSDRMYRLEELRLETVHEFARHLFHADEVLRWSSRTKRHGESLSDGGNENDAETHGNDGEEVKAETNDSELYQTHQHNAVQDKPGTNLWQRWNFLRGHPSTAHRSTNPLKGLSSSQVQSSITSAHQLIADARSILPQLVSTVLHSPPSLLPSQVNYGEQGDPISKLRSLLLQQCQLDPSLGIELCWLLEAEVGRKWKALFEHRQQSGKRLILVVPADIAAAITEVGAEKASAFNLLQDAEMCTAFGREREDPSTMYHGYHDEQHQYLEHQGHAAGHLPHHGTDQHAFGHSQHQSEGDHRDLSDLRCRHFGDSMHFVDRLSQISLDLRGVPPPHRQAVLEQRLYELNQRLLRRMVSRGSISLDVEDSWEYHQQQQQQPQYQQYGGHNQYQGFEQHHYQPYGQVGHQQVQPPRHLDDSDVKEDMVNYSVHFPMEPQSVAWPGGKSSDSSQQQQTTTATDFEHPPQRNGVVRALRILPSQCRILDSRERCPFLVRMEVFETGLEANDPRLYDIEDGAVSQKNGAAEEVLPSPVVENIGENENPNTAGKEEVETDEARPRYQYSHLHERLSLAEPSKRPTIGDGQGKNPLLSQARLASDSSKAVFSRGGYQSNEDYYNNPPGMYGTNDIREQCYEQLHHDLRHQRESQFNSNPQTDPQTETQYPGQEGAPFVAGTALLDEVFGKQWTTECEEMRQQSPYRDVKGWKLASFIIKAGEDIRKEALVMQIMSKLWTWFQDEIPTHSRPFLRPYTIMCVGGDAGIVECLPDVRSINDVKKSTDGFVSLRNFFERAFGPPVQTPYAPDNHNEQVGAVSFEKARDNFLRSLVGYSVVCYILQIKDRHNANILMDREGHIMVCMDMRNRSSHPLLADHPISTAHRLWICSRRNSKNGEGSLVQRTGTVQTIG